MRAGENLKATRRRGLIVIRQGHGFRVFQVDLAVQTAERARARRVKSLGIKTNVNSNQNRQRASIMLQQDMLTLHIQVQVT